MQPSSKYESTQQTYAGGFVYKETTQNFSDIFKLDDELDMSVSYTTPINSNLNSVTMGGWNNSTASAYVTKNLEFSKNWLIPAGTRSYCNVNGLSVSKDSFSSNANVTVVFAKGNQSYYYFGKSAQASTTVGSFAQKLVTDFDISHVVFKAIITGWSKADFEYFINNGTLQDSDGYSINFDDFMANPSDYYIRTFDVYAYAYWNGSIWRDNQVTQSPNIHIYFLINSDKVSGICNLNRHHYNAASGTNAFGVEYKAVSNSTSGNTTEITALPKGSVASELNSSVGFVLDKAVTPLVLDLDISADELQTMCDSGVTGDYNTLPAHEVEFCPAVRVLRCDKFSMSYDAGTSGLTHPTNYRMYFCSGLKGEYLSKLLAYAGVYFYTGTVSDLNTSGADPSNLKVTGMRLGEMNSAGQTTGNWIEPNQMDDYQGINRSGSIIHPSYDPTAGGDEGDSVDDMTINPLFGMSSDAGFASYFLLNTTQLNAFHTWLTDTDFPDGYDPYSYIISLIQFPMALTPTWCLAGTAGNIALGGLDSEISANLIGTEQTWRGLGTFTVPRLNGNYLDYDPYTQYECYIPCCGWITLPDTVAGREISVRINYDLTTAAIIGNVYVKINGDSLLIASKSGMMGRETVVSGEAQGVRSAQITSALFSAGTGALNVATGLMSGNAVAAVSGGYHIAAGLSQANIASNSSYARQIGSTGGRALLCQYDRCYLKVTTTRADIPANYGHTVGYICNKAGQVSSFRGFTVFENFDTTGISGMTERERAEVKRIMESGVYINAAP